MTLWGGAVLFVGELYPAQTTVWFLGFPTARNPTVTWLWEMVTQSHFHKNVERCPRNTVQRCTEHVPGVFKGPAIFWVRMDLMTQGFDPPPHSSGACVTDRVPQWLLAYLSTGDALCFTRWTHVSPSLRTVHNFLLGALEATSQRGRSVQVNASCRQSGVGQAVSFPRTLAQLLMLPGVLYVFGRWEPISGPRRWS